MKKSLAIKNIAIKKCGPLENISLTFSEKANLIYAKNETGKSYLAEFIINDILTRFKDKSKKRGREQKPPIDFRIRNDIEGEIIYNDSSLSIFNDLTQEQIFYLLDLITIREGKPSLSNKNTIVITDIARYLSLKTFNIFDKFEFQQSAVGIDLDNFLSDDIIDNKIKNRGLGNAYRNLLDDLNRCKSLISRAESINITEIRNLQSRIKELQRKKESLQKAKRRKAFELSQEIKSLNSSLEKYPENSIQKLESLVSDKKELENKIDDLKKEISKEQKLKDELEELEKQEEIQHQAAAYKGYSLKNNILELEKILEKYNENLINSLQNYLASHKEIKIQFDDKIKKLQETNLKISQISFLKNGKEIVRAYETAASSALKDRILYIIFAIISFVAAIILISSDQFYSAALFGAAAFFIYKFASARKKYEHEFANYENFKSTFASKFGYSSVNASIIEEKIQELIILESTRNTLKNDCEALEKKLIELKNGIKLYFDQLEFKTDESRWEESLEQIKTQKSQIQKQINDLNIELKKLNISESSLSSENPGVEYNRSLLVDIQHKITEVKSKIKEIESKKSKLESLLRELANINENIKKIFYELNIKDIKEENYALELNLLKKQREEILRKIKSAEGELKGLAVDPKDYISDNIEIQYDENEYLKIDKELEDASNEHSEKSSYYQEFKGELKNYLENDTDNFNNLLYALFEKRDKIIDKIKSVEADILAQKILHDSLEKIKNDKATFVKNILSSDSFKDLLRKLGLKAKELIADGDMIKFSDGKSSYSFDYLSVGAKDQFFIALRLETIKNILGTDRIFLLFDDAFQHSDYERREKLVDLFFEFCKDGFQMIYFTMDDHLRDLFEKTASLKNIEFKVHLLVS